MNVPSLSFVGFAVGGAIVFNLSRSATWRRLVLLVMNIACFATFLASATAAIPYLGFLLMGYVGIKLLSRRPTTPLFLFFLAAVLFSFFELKRYGFIPSQIYLPMSYTTVGLSYVFFRVLHLIIDARQGALAGPMSPVSYVNYTMNFAALVSGPIQFYPDYRRMEEEIRLPLDLFAVARAGERIILGYFKVAVLSVLLMKAQQAAIGQLAVSSGLVDRTLCCGLICAIYPLFLYANFSGYTDFVIGAARLFRMELPENFNDPFSSENFIAFWSRWHITLSHWLKTYVYTPLVMASMSRFPSVSLEPYFGVAAYFVTFFLVGAWHGQTTIFLFFGFLQGGGVAMNKLYQIAMTRRLSSKGYRALGADPLYAALARGFTFTWFAFTLLWFWSSWDQLDGFVSIAGIPTILAALVLVFVVATLVLAARARLRPLWNRPVREGAISPSRYWRTIASTAMLVIVVALALILSGPAPDLVYKNF